MAEMTERNKGGGYRNGKRRNLVPRTVGTSRYKGSDSV